ncbi:MAG: DMT family transporter [Alphaproteobacteria bacterium]|nr:DMT family transporter [Alphaproteobacteria bacterium]
MSRSSAALTINDQDLTITGKPAELIRLIPGLPWFFRRGYVQGVFWALMICLTSVTNDVLMRFMGQGLHPLEIVFFRFFFSMISVLPFMIPSGLALFKTSRPSQHFVRALVGAGAIVACCYSVNLMPLSENTTIMFAEPLFVLPLAVIFLRENVDSGRWIATIFGFIGLLIIVQPGTETFQTVALFPITAAFLFALSNIISKIMVSREHTLTMLFYFGVGTTLVAAFTLPWVWKMPTMNELFFLALLGIGANMIQVCLFRAFAATDASALMPFRYTELLFSATIGFLLFSEIPRLWILAGGSLIIASNFYITWREINKEKRV